MDSMTAQTVARFSHSEWLQDDDLRIEIRRNDDGTIDEVVMYDERGAIFHLEQVSKGGWYFTLGRTGEGLFHISRYRRHVDVRADSDTQTPSEKRRAAKGAA